MFLPLYGLVLFSLVQCLWGDPIVTTKSPQDTIVAPTQEDEDEVEDELQVQLKTYGVIMNDLELCGNIANKTFLPFVGNNSSYIYCVGGNVSSVDTCAIPERVEAECGEEPDCTLVFNYKLQTCTTNIGIEHLTFMPQCVENVLSSFCYDRTCTKYVLCYYNLPVLRECQDNLQYNAETDRCDFPEFVDCVENECSQEITPANITYLASKASCDKYFICADGMPYAQECTEGLYFDESCSCCRPKDKASADQTAQQRNIKPFSRSPPQRADILCPQRGVHFFAHKRRRDAYYYCVQGNGITLDCTPGLLFDPKTRECREPKNIA
ncbi:hypothetical protein KR093_000372 [Drosophila rubida]|uniref:Chitin-binding type-2 domain-containing protein n=1 Tax=Drosophila rubida TaxID=30044 RepID=A0AAD4JXY1_9MUSC|nr:hypothetical protein KR093_000372 [Drosophila rubida]